MERFIVYINKRLFAIPFVGICVPFLPFAPDFLLSDQRWLTRLAETPFSVVCWQGRKCVGYCLNEEVSPDLSVAAHSKSRPSFAFPIPLTIFGPRSAGGMLLPISPVAQHLLAVYWEAHCEGAKAGELLHLAQSGACESARGLDVLFAVYSHSLWIAKLRGFKRVLLVAAHPAAREVAASLDFKEVASLDLTEFKVYSD